MSEAVPRNDFGCTVPPCPDLASRLVLCLEEPSWASTSKIKEWAFKESMDQDVERGIEKIIYQPCGTSRLIECPISTEPNSNPCPCHTSTSDDAELIYNFDVVAGSQHRALSQISRSCPATTMGNLQSSHKISAQDKFVSSSPIRNIP